MFLLEEMYMQQAIPDTAFISASKHDLRNHFLAILAGEYESDIEKYEDFPEDPLAMSKLDKMRIDMQAESDLKKREKLQKKYTEYRRWWYKEKARREQLDLKNGDPQDRN